MSLQPFNFFPNETFSSKHKGFLYLYFLPLLTLLYQLLLTNFPWKAQISNFFVILITISTFSTFLKVRSWFFGLWCTILVSFAPFIVVLMNKEFQFYFLGYSFFNPLIILIFSNNQVFCLISCLIQIFILNFNANNFIWENNYKFDVENIGSNLIEAFLTHLFEIVVVLSIIHLQKRKYEINKPFQKDEEKPRQKKHAHCFSFEIRDALNSLNGSLQMINSKELPANDQEMLKIAKLSTEKIHRLFNNMVDLFELDSDVPGIVFNLAETFSFFKKIWKILGASIQRKNQVG